MERGTIWRLKAATVGVAETESRLGDRLGHDRRSTVVVPAEALLKIVEARSESAFVEVEWNDRHFLIFRVDLRERGEEMT